jgi:putative DNA primase/helicase
MLLAVGPTRAGKSTIAAILRGLVGEGNTAGPTLAGLAENFGLSALFGKQLAIVADARLSGRADAAAVTERLLSISGEDAVTVDRKFREPITCKLNTRFTIISNELPRLIDASGALVSRLLVLRFTRSWLDKEDHDLKDRLAKELPGILNWSLDGLARLRKTGRFTQPNSGAELLADIRDLSSPVGAFVRARCRVGGLRRVRVTELYDAWVQWCQEQGRKEPGTAPMFGRDLAAAVPTVRLKQIREGPKRYRVYEGIELGEPDEPELCHAMPRESCHCGVNDAEGDGRSTNRNSHVTSRDTLPQKQKNEEKDTLKNEELNRVDDGLQAEHRALPSDPIITRRFDP